MSLIIRLRRFLHIDLRYLGSCWDSIENGLSSCLLNHDFCRTCNQAFKKFQSKNGLWDHLWCQGWCEPEFFSEKHNAGFLWANERNIIFQFYELPLKIQTVVIRLGPADDDIGFGTLLGVQNEPSVQKGKRITEATGFFLTRNTLFCRNLSGTFHLF